MLVSRSWVDRQCPLCGSSTTRTPDGSRLQCDLCCPSGRRSGTSFDGPVSPFRPRISTPRTPVDEGFNDSSPPIVAQDGSGESLAARCRLLSSPKSREQSKEQAGNLRDVDDGERRTWSPQMRMQRSSDSTDDQASSSNDFRRRGSSRSTWSPFRRGRIESLEGLSLSGLSELRLSSETQEFDADTPREAPKFSAEIPREAQRFDAEISRERLAGEGDSAGRDEPTRNQSSKERLQHSFGSSDDAVRRHSFNSSEGTRFSFEIEEHNLGNPTTWETQRQRRLSSGSGENTWETQRQRRLSTGSEENTRETQRQRRLSTGSGENTWKTQRQRQLSTASGDWRCRMCGEEACFEEGCQNCVSPGSPGSGQGSTSAFDADSAPQTHWDCISCDARMLPGVSRECRACAAPTPRQLSSVASESPRHVSKSPSNARKNSRASSGFQSHGFWLETQLESRKDNSPGSSAGIGSAGQGRDGSPWYGSLGGDSSPERAAAKPDGEKQSRAETPIPYPLSLGNTPTTPIRYPLSLGNTPTNADADAYPSITEAFAGLNSGGVGQGDEVEGDNAPTAGNHR